jgi:hypothetical protein
MLQLNKRERDIERDWNILEEQARRGDSVGDFILLIEVNSVLSLLVTVRM